MTEAPHFTWDDFLRSLPLRDREEVERSGIPGDLRKGDVLFQQGEAATSMHVIVEGQVELVFQGVEATKLLGPGDMLGEIAILTQHHHRTATAIATQNVCLLTFDQAAFEGLARHNPVALMSLLRETCSYLLASEQRLIDDLRRKNGELERALDYLRRTREELDSQELLAQTDDLTGLYNRRCLNAQLGSFMRRAREAGGGLSVMLADLDGLKPLNDQHGHTAGDMALKLVANIIRSSVRRADLPCRIGGDEFAVVLVGITETQAVSRAEQIRQRIAATPVTLTEPEREYRVTISLGGATYRVGDTSLDIMERADQALYLAKNRGRNRVAWEGHLPECSGVH